MKLRINKTFGIMFIPLLIIILQFAHVGGLNISWLLYIVMFFQVLIHYKMVLRNLSLTVLTVAIIVWPLISQLWSISSGFYVNVYFSIITGFVVSLYICTLGLDTFEVFARGVFFACMVFIVLGLFEIFTGRYLLVRNSIFMIRLNINRLHYPIVAFANPNDLGQFLALLLPISSVFLLEHKKIKTIRYQAIVLLSNVVGLYVIFNTESNLSMIVFLGTYLVYFFTSRKRINKNNVIRWMFIIILFIVVFTIVENKTHIMERIASNVLFVSTDDIHYIRRFNLYQSLIKSIFKHPFGGFGNAYSITEPHNFFLYIFSDYGLLGGALFVIYYISLIHQTIIHIRTEETTSIQYLLLASLFLFPLSSSISSGNEQRKSLWILIGFYMYYQLLYKNDNTAMNNDGIGNTLLVNRVKHIKNLKGS